MENKGNTHPNRYDQIPYMGISHSLTHPDTLATVGTLLGLKPVNILNCRVLELGCANGSNLIPMALGLPDSQFIGLDFSAVQIAQGQQAIEKLGLKNATLKHMDILDVDSSLGQFDYIIVHGIFSWVSEKVRDKILSICNQNLTTDGIAYISYNTFPGWYHQKAVRDMMIYFTRKVNDPHLKIDHARNFLNFMSTSAESMLKQTQKVPEDSYVSVLRREKERLGTSSDTYLFHEELEENNDPIYFYQFIEWAERHGLQYLSEANLEEVFMNEIPSEIRDKLLGIAKDITELEQYRDFLINRLFRGTLLVHKELNISRRINPDRISKLYVGSNNLPVSPNPNIYTRSVEQFVCSSGVKLATDHPVTKAAMIYLGKIWPRVIPLDELLEKAYDCLRRALPDSETPIPDNREMRSLDMQVLKANLLKGFVSSSYLIELRVHAPEFANYLSDYPVASPWARLQVMTEASTLKALKNEKRDPFTVTNLRHQRIELEGVTPYLLYHLDGKCSRDQLLSKLEISLKDGSLIIKSQREPGPANMEQVKQDLATNLDEDLRWLVNSALLIA